ncbi:MAG: zinc-dependent metalloprotease [Planctomycetes bacterium]|nr:zinc-dependent metalloprotease [Planctomycetota bacterium]
MLPKHTSSAVRLSVIASLTLAVGFSSIASAQRRPGGWAGRGDRQADNSDDKDKKKDAIKPYDEVITDEAVTKRGLFHVHQIDDDLYYEIPVEAFGKDMLWVTQVAETTAGSSYAGMPAGDRVVRWEQRGEKVLLRDVRYGIRADTDDPIADAVKASNLAPIIKVFPVKAYGKDKMPVIKVTDLFTKDVAEFSAKRALNAGNMDSGRTFIEQVKSFPQNIEIKVLATYSPSSDDSRGGGTRSPFARRGPTTSGITAMIHHSMIKLPENPMKPRLHDSRVGFFSVSFVDFADDKNHAAPTVRYITRWRLEKSDPEAELSEPIKPIVFYVGRGTPEKWKSYVKAGIEDWQPAFEAAGFKNAIIGKYAPDPHEDPDWDAEDARISTIRWLPASIKNAFGPHVHDPRTGEILEADVRMYHDVQKLVRDWYFVQAAAVDERAQSLPMPDDLIGELIRFVVAHEVGHSLGFPHNMKASSSYSIEQLRDADWVKNNGTAPSIMDYARFNYVAQPGDEAGLLPRVGPYDYFAAEWGYRQFASDADEKAELESIAKRQIDEPMFRYGGGGDPTAQTEDLSNQAVQATTLGLQNLERIAAMLVDATSKEGEDYDLLDNMYNQLFGQWNREMGHVANIVGGVEQVNLYYGDADQRFFPLDPDYQRDAVRFLVENALRTPHKMIPPEISLRLTADGVADRVLSAQSRLLRTLVNARRINRMAEHAENIEYGAYTPAEMLADLRYGIYSELNDTPIDIDIYRRNLQRTYVQMLGSLIENPSANSDLPALARAELVALGASIEGCDSEAADNAIVTAHLRDLSARIEAALDHRATRAAPSATPAPTGRRRAGSEDSPDRGWCSVPLETHDH